jgi:hypothetical protein
VLLILWATDEVAREHVVDLCCQSRGHVASELLLFALILLL